MNRRKLFTNFASSKAPIESRSASLGVELYTNPMLRTHENKEVRFYDDLMKGKQVVVNFMYATCEGACPLVTSKLVKVHEALRSRMGKDLFMYSISIKPEQDTPEALKEFAEMHQANLPGWTFLTGDPYDIETIRYRLWRWNHIKFDLDLDLHTSMLRIINDATNCWTMVTPYASQYTILEHIGWADPPKTFKERVEDNKRLQQEINKEVKRYGYRRIA